MLLVLDLDNACQRGHVADIFFPKCIYMEAILQQDLQKAKEERMEEVLRHKT